MQRKESEKSNHSGSLLFPNMSACDTITEVWLASHASAGDEAFTTEQIPLRLRHTPN